MGEKTKTNTKEKQINRSAGSMAYQRRHREKGICILCPQKVSSYTGRGGEQKFYQYCDEHRAKQKARRDSKLKESGHVSRTHCGICGGRGHNRQTCPKTGDEPRVVGAGRRKEPKKTYSCSGCGEPGHSIRTCPEGREAYEDLKHQNKNGLSEKYQKEEKAARKSKQEQAAKELVKQLRTVYKSSMAVADREPDMFHLSGLEINVRMSKMMYEQLKAYRENGAVSSADWEFSKKAQRELTKIYQKFAKAAK